MAAAANVKKKKKKKKKNGGATAAAISKAAAWRHGVWRGEKKHVAAAYGVAMLLGMATSASKRRHPSVCDGNLAAVAATSSAWRNRSVSWHKHRNSNGMAWAWRKRKSRREACVISISGKAAKHGAAIISVMKISSEKSASWQRRHHRRRSSMSMAKLAKWRQHSVYVLSKRKAASSSEISMKAASGGINQRRTYALVAAGSVTSASKASVAKSLASAARK